VTSAILDAIPATGQESASRPIAAVRALGPGVAAAAAIVLAIVGLVVLMVPRPSDVPGGSPVPSGSSAAPPSPLPAARASGVTAIALGVDTWALAVDERSVWVQYGDAGIARIDRATNADTGIRVPEVPHMQFEGPELWALDVGTGIVRLDPITGAVERTIPGVDGSFLLVDGMTAWVTDVGHSLDRVDLASGTVVKTIDVPAAPKEMAVLDGWIWVTCDGGGSVARVDVRTNKVIATIPVGERPANLVAAEGAVWVWNHQQKLVRIDPATNQVVATIDGVAEGPGAGLAAGGGFLWVAMPDGIGQIDPASNTVVRVIPVGPDAFVDLVWFEDELWASTANGNLVYRIDPSP
jgi:YVTN family beta-propeller protein